MLEVYFDNCEIFIANLDENDLWRDQLIAEIERVLAEDIERRNGPGRST